MNRLQLQKMLLCFQMLKAQGPQYKSEGICHNVDCVMTDMGCTYQDNDGNPFKIMMFYKHQLEIVHNWPEYSGNTSYPICTGAYPTGHLEYVRARASNSQWNKTPYGYARRRLLDFIIVSLQEQLNTLES